ncbi:MULTISPECIES: hypothetical protein [Pseudomonas]|uniref:Uncharacterized protein n=1 Tax=Pseudomonas aphyarum TaxID=2942629 RepID=A0ABT5PK39_9PSED|nr:hypothetical protein [Pseudomonas aphyarum]MDD0970669.1 hypothetical protein [Pseudomonas aphyarum]MDD1123931.1 hypothetical protein [Pseudomonas aphyarum]
MTAKNQAGSGGLVASLFRRPLRVALLLALLIIIVLVQSCSWFAAPIGNYVAEKVFPDLDPPPEREAPPTFKQYLSSPISQAILGGRGRGLNCSIPEIGKSLFETPEQTASVSLHFRPSCVMHDLCYRHGYATYGYAQADCDRALQTSAFRMCRQINKSLGNEKPIYDDCQTEAKKVLLGVSLGGAGSFRASGKSTYFEYDPMPEKADNYVVARAFAINQAQAASGELGVIAYHFLRNSVRAKMLRVDPGDPRRLLEVLSDPAPYPGQLIATAPTTEWLGNGQSSMIAVARNSFSDTRVGLVQFSPLLENNKISLSLKPCPQPWVAAKCSPDLGSSIARLANVDGRPMLVSLAHWAGFKASDSSSRVHTVKLVRSDLAGDPIIDDYTLNAQLGIRDRYRFLQNELLLEKDAQGRDTHAWILVRGMKLDPASGLIVDNPDAKGYEDRLLVIRQPLADGQAGNTQRFVVDAKEVDDPLSLIHLQEGSGVALAGLSWSREDLERLEDAEPAAHSPFLSLWRLPQDVQPSVQAVVQSERIPLDPALKNDFIDRPPVVINAPGFAAPIVVWTRMAAETKLPVTQASFDVVFNSLDSTPDVNHKSALTRLGAISCTLDLKQQLYSDNAKPVRQNANRAEGERSATALTPVTEGRGVNELFRRWKMSQTIVSKKPSGDSALDDLTVTVVFNGYTSMSFQAVLKSTDGRLRFSQTLPQAQYLSCKDL